MLGSRPFFGNAATARVCQHGRSPGICGECFPSEITTVDRDREFDQTAKTVTEPRHVSPAIHEHRINILEQEKRELTEMLELETVAHGKTQHTLNLAEIRINQFENFTRTLAAKCDQMIERCDELGVDILDLPPAVEMENGKRTTENIAAVKTPPAVESVTCGQVSSEYGRCILLRYHLGPCLGGAAAAKPAVETHADGVRETASNPCNQVSPHSRGRCVKPRYHLGPCMTGAAA